MARVAIQALAAVLGGTQSLHTNSLDEALALPSEEAVTVALRTQQIIAHESGVTNTVDPLGGSYFVEALTDEVERQARDYFRQIDEHGGVLPALEEGFFQREITEAAVRYQREVESRRRIIVGVNDYVSGEQQKVPILEMDVEGYRRQIGAAERSAPHARQPGSRPAAGRAGPGRPPGETSISCRRSWTPSTSTPRCRR